MMNVASYVASVVGVIGAVLLALPRARTTSQHRYALFGLLLLSGTVASGAPATLRLAVQVEPVPHLVRVLNAAMAMFGLYCLVGIVIHSTRSPEAAARLARKHFVILAIWVLIASACLYLSRTQPTVLRMPTGSNFWLRTYWNLLLVYDGAALIGFLVLSYRMVRLPDSTQLVRQGFRMALIAAMAALVHHMWAIAVTLRILPFPIDQQVGALLLGVALILLTVGLTVPIWGGLAYSAVAWVGGWRVKRVLKTLWSDLAELRAVVDTSHLTSVPTSVQRRAVSKLHRSWLALRDVQLAARPYVHPAVRSWVADAAQRHGLSTAATLTLIEAAELGTALDAVRSGEPPRSSGPRSGGTIFERRKRARRSTDNPPCCETMPDLRAEARHLSRVGFALRYSPLVARMRYLASLERAEHMDRSSTSVDAAR